MSRQAVSLGREYTGHARVPSSTPHLALHPLSVCFLAVDLELPGEERTNYPEP